MQMPTKLLDLDPRIKNHDDDDDTNLPEVTRFLCLWSLALINCNNAIILHKFLALNSYHTPAKTEFFLSVSSIQSS